MTNDVYVLPKAHCRRCAGVTVLDSDRVCWNCRIADFDEAGNWLEEHPLFKLRNSHRESK